jgi:hypothetical protein
MTFHLLKVSDKYQVVAIRDFHSVNESRIQELEPISEPMSFDEALCELRRIDTEVSRMIFWRRYAPG